MASVLIAGVILVVIVSSNKMKNKIKATDRMSLKEIKRFKGFLEQQKIKPIYCFRFVKRFPFVKIDRYWLIE